MLTRTRALPALALALAGCLTATGSLPMPEELVAAGAAPAGSGPAALARGRALTVTRCAGCHRLYWPQSYSPEAWRPIARKMARLSSLNAGQAADLELYLVAASTVTTRRTPARRMP